MATKKIAPKAAPKVNEPAKEPVKEPVKAAPKKAPKKPVADNFKTGVPKLVTHGIISSHSKSVTFKDVKGKVHRGRYMVYTTDVNSPGITVKKGDAIWYTRDNVTIKNVVGYKDL